MSDLAATNCGCNDCGCDESSKIKGYRGSECSTIALFFPRSTHEVAHKLCKAKRASAKADTPCAF